MAAGKFSSSSFHAIMLQGEGRDVLDGLGMLQACFQSEQVGTTRQHGQGGGGGGQGGGGPPPPPAAMMRGRRKRVALI